MCTHKSSHMSSNSQISPLSPQVSTPASMEEAEEESASMTKPIISGQIEEMVIEEEEKPQMQCPELSANFFSRMTL